MSHTENQVICNMYLKPVGNMNDSGLCRIILLNVFVVVVVVVVMYLSF